jgi:hypothetical protein
MASASRAPPQPPPLEDYYDEEADFKFPTKENSDSSDVCDEEAAPDGGDYVCTAEEEREWMWRAARRSIRSEAKHHRKHEAEAAAEEEMQQVLAASKEAVKVAVAAAPAGPSEFPGPNFG